MSVFVWFKSHHMRGCGRKTGWGEKGDEGMNGQKDTWVG